MATDAMRIIERYQYLHRWQSHYNQADRETKKQLLDQMVAYTCMHRKSVIRRLRGRVQRTERGRGRSRAYGAAVDAARQLIWKTLDYICPARLQPNLVSTAQWLARHHELQWSAPLAAHLGQISVSTVSRHLPPSPGTATAPAVGARQSSPSADSGLPHSTGYR